MAGIEIPKAEVCPKIQDGQNVLDISSENVDSMFRILSRRFDGISVIGSIGT